DEALLELRHRPLHVAEMDVEDLPARTEMLDHLDHVRPAAGHLRAAPEAEIESPRLAGAGFLRDSLGPLEILRLRENSRHAAEHLHGWVVRMERELHAGVLRHWQHR